MVMRGCVLLNKLRAEMQELGENVPLQDRKNDQSRLKGSSMAKIFSFKLFLT